MKYLKTSLLAFSLANAAYADSYQVFFPSTMPGMIQSNGVLRTDLNLVVVNTDSMKVTTVDLDDYISTFDNSRYALGANYSSNVDGTSLNADKRLIQDFKGTSLFIRENGAIWSYDMGADGQPGTGDDGNNMYYDRILELNVTNGEIVSETLIATSQEGYDAAVAAGYEVKLAATGDTSGATLINFKSYSENISNATAAAGTIATRGNFSTNQITSSDGSSLFRQEDDGTVHIGQNSIVLADELVSASGNDEIYSSSNVLQLGNTNNHRTIIKGTLEVPKPTIGAHAANKDYVDGIGAMAMAASQISLQSDPNSTLSFGIGLGGMGNQGAYAIGLTGKNQENGVRYSLTAAYNENNGEVGYGAAMVWSLR